MNFYFLYISFTFDESLKEQKYRSFLYPCWLYSLSIRILIRIVMLCLTDYRSNMAIMCRK